MSGSPLVSVIIPCREIDDYARECVRHCRQLGYGNFEMILLPDDVEEKVEETRIITTGPVTPGRKRNIGMANSNGEICAFIDSDAYPSRDWLRNAVKYLADPQVVAVGGPGITPDDDDVMRRASGYVLSSFMVGGISSRYKTKRVFDSCDIHSCNFIARKFVLKEVGGWNEKYWPGEDTLICQEIKKLGKRLIEASDVVVYHHRRPLFVQHSKQVSRFGLHRGFFMKRFKGNSFKMTYLFPPLLVLYLFASVFISMLNPLYGIVVLSFVALYLALGLAAALLRVRNIRLVLLVWLGIVTTHVVYGVSFLVGLMKRELDR